MSRGTRRLDCGCLAHGPGPGPEGIIILPRFRDPDCDIYHNYRRCQNARSGGRQTLHLRNSIDDYTYEFVSDGLKVNHVPTDSAYYGYLYAGDVITHVDFALYQRGLITPLREQLAAGHRDSVMISVQRLRFAISLVYELVKG